MPIADAAPNLPHSLQALMADARESLERWEREPIDFDDEQQADWLRDWTLRLSRGEVDDDLYWKCVAEDCEREGDWEGAIAAYDKVLAATDSHPFSPHANIAAILSLLGRHAEALKRFRLAVKQLATEEVRIFYRVALADEACQLLSMGRARSAQRVVEAAMLTFEEETEDGLGLARTVTLRACCALELKDRTTAKEALDAAWSMLEDLQKVYPGGSGVHHMAAMWWRAEAKRRQLAGEAATEIEAWEQAVTEAKAAAEGWDRLSSDANVMRRLLNLAEAYERHWQTDEATESRREAETLRAKWHLPVASAPAPAGIWRRVARRFGW
jgi:tetratricopeptide (TPR) repeat protein